MDHEGQAGEVSDSYDGSSQGGSQGSNGGQQEMDIGDKVKYK